MTMAVTLAWCGLVIAGLIGVLVLLARWSEREEKWRRMKAECEVDAARLADELGSESRVDMDGRE